MLVWGGFTAAVPAVTNTGGLYDPVTDTWQATSTMNAPAARFFHSAVWTGSKMLVWGGFGATALEAAGGIYDPETDTWSAMSMTNQPKPRTKAKVVWTGKKLIVWGGTTGSTAEGTGGIYDPEKDTWEAVNPAAAPSPRLGFGMGWSGKVAMVWGGTNYIDWFNTGALFDPEGAPMGVWTASTPSSGVPPVREQPSLDFVNSVFVAWGGWDGGPTVNSGATLDPTTNTWMPMNVEGVPTARTNHVGVAAGGHLLVWGGCLESLCEAAKLASDGGQFVPYKDGGTWYPIESQAALAARYSASIVYTGSGAIVWGGRLDSQTSTNSGAYTPL